MDAVRTLLLASVALIGAGGLAGAAELPTRKAAPVDAVRVCEWTDAGFLSIPGTDTCLNIGAFVRIEGAFSTNSRTLTPAAAAPDGRVVPGRERDEAGFLARTRFGVDTRTQTAYGTLRTFIQYQVDRVQGLYSEGGLAGGANTIANGGGNNVTLRRGYIQFAGVTVGRVQSLFDFYADLYNYESISDSNIAQNVFAYTYNAAGGLAATLSVEDRIARNLGQQGLGYIYGGADATAAAVRYGGETVPDLVGVLREDQSWGSAQLSGAYHEVQAESGPFAGTGGQGFSGARADGYAVQAGLRLKLPMLAAGDDVWLEGAYQNGAYLYQDSAYYMNQGSFFPNIGGFQHVDRDAIAIHTPGSAPGTYGLQTGSGFSAMFALNHIFTPKFHDVIFGSYEQTSYGTAGRIDWTQGGLGFGEQYRIGNQFLFDPARNLEIGLELDYSKLNQTLAHDVDQVATALPAGVSRNPDNFQVRLRVERDF